MKRRFTAAISCLLAVLLCAQVVCADNTEAPRPYFPYPDDLESIPVNHSLPDPFTFFDASADPNGNGRVDSPDEWPARREELMDLMSYYLLGSRMDPLKTDTTVVAVKENYEYQWTEGVMQGEASAWGYTELPKLPEGSYTMTPLDFSAFGMGVYYSNFAPDENYVHSGEDFVIAEGLAPWKEGDTWTEHSDLVQRITLPTVTVDMLIKDTNPDNASYRSSEASEGVVHSFNIRFPETAPEVDGVIRDEKASRNGTGYPVLVSFGGLSEEQIVTLNNNGYVYITVDDACNPDSGQISVYEKLYPPEDPVVHNDNTTVNEYQVDSGDLMHSGWIASRALDAVENYMLLSSEEKEALNPDVILPDVDVYSSAVTGCSHNGKRAIICGLFDTGDDGDTRFDIIAPSDPCAGGTVGYRYITEGELFSYQPPESNGPEGPVVHNYAYGLNETMQRAIQNVDEDQWFCDRAQILTVHPELADHVPFDALSLIASFASLDEDRYFLTWAPEGQDAWANSPSAVLNVQAAREVYEYLGYGDNIAVIVRDQAHANQDRDLPDLIAVMDKLYYNADTIVRKYFSSLAQDNGLFALDGSGVIRPEQEFDSVASMERNPFYIPSRFLDWSRPTKHYLWTETNSVTENVAMDFTFHTDARRVELTLPDEETVLSADVADGTATISLTADQAKAGQYKATAIGDKDSKSIEICGWTLKDALRHSITDNSALGHDVGSGIAFTTALTNYDSETDPVLLYMNGEPLATDIYDYDYKVTLADGTVVPQSGYLQPYGGTLLLYPDSDGYAVPMGEKVVFSMRNAKLEALQGFIISVDVELEKYDPNEGNPNAAPRMRWRTTYQTDNTQTPVWEPQLLQNTPKSGLPAGEDRWPILGNWQSDYDEELNLRPVDEIRPLYSTDAVSDYNAEISLGDADEQGFVINFSAPVNKNDFALAVNTVAGYSYEWSEDAQSVQVTYDAPLSSGDTVTAIVFRSVDSEGHMITEPTRFDIEIQG